MRFTATAFSIDTGHGEAEVHGLVCPPFGIHLCPRGYQIVWLDRGTAIGAYFLHQLADAKELCVILAQFLNGTRDAFVASPDGPAAFNAFLGTCSYTRSIDNEFYACIIPKPPKAP